MKFNESISTENPNLNSLTPFQRAAFDGKTDHVAYYLKGSLEERIAVAAGILYNKLTDPAWAERIQEVCVLGNEASKELIERRLTQLIFFEAQVSIAAGVCFPILKDFFEKQVELCATIFAQILSGPWKEATPLRSAIQQLFPSLLRIGCFTEEELQFFIKKILKHLLKKIRQP